MNMSFTDHVIQFIVMFLLGVFFNPMNMLAYSLDHFYLSQTLINGGLLMASNMIWAHELVHYFTKGHIDYRVYGIGITLSIMISVLLLRNQWMVDDKNWLRRMIGHHSTAITTTKQLLNSGNHFDNPAIFRLAKDIILNQEMEILLMKSML